MELCGFRYRAYPDEDQLILLVRHAGACRAVWNIALEQRRTALGWWQQSGRPRRFAWPSYTRQCAELKELRNDLVVAPWFAETPMQMLQQTLRDLDRAWSRWVAGKGGMPRFKKLTEGRSIRDPQHVWVKRTSKRFGIVKIQGVGKIRVRLHRPVSGAVKHATVIQEADGKWFVSLTIVRRTHKVASNGKPAVGIDLGIAVPVATSDGELIGSKLLTLRPKELERVLRLERHLSRCVRGSKNERKMILRINQLKARQRHRRTDFVEQVSRDLTQNHGLVVFENLQVKKMTKSARGTVDNPGKNVRQKAGLNRAILNRSWGAIVTRTEQKAAKAGSQVIFVPAAYTSQECPICHMVAAANRVSQSRFVCTSCGHEGNADVKAAITILERAFGRGLVPAVADGTSVAASQGDNPGRWSRATSGGDSRHVSHGSRNKKRGQGRGLSRHPAEASALKA